MIGGGDTFCEDLYFFAGAPGIKYGYDVLIVDLPGQGDTPFQNLYFRTEYEIPISVIIDYIETLSDININQIAIYGVSGGGYMVLRAVAYEKRIKACIANSPVFDMEKILQSEIPKSLLKEKSLFGKFILKLVGRFNKTGKINMERYIWQAGVSNPIQALRISKNAKVKIELINCAILCLTGEGEPFELQRQAYEVYQSVPSSVKTYRKFTSREGADAHCQVNNFSLLNRVVFNWLDEIFEYSSK